MPKLTILDRYIFRECLTSFLIATGVLTTIMFIGSAFRLLTTEAKGLDMVDVMRVAPLILPYVLVNVLPFSVLIGTLSGYTRLSSDREMTAMKLAGVPAARLAAPALFLGLVLTLASFYTSNYLTPDARHRLSDFVRSTVTKLITRLSESRNNVEYDGPHSTWKFHWKGVRDGRLRDLVVCKSPRISSKTSKQKAPAEPKEPTEILYAASGAFRMDPYDNLIKFELEGLLGYYDLHSGAIAPTTGDKSDRSDPADRVLRNDGHNRKIRFRGGNFAVTVDLDAAEAEDKRGARAKNRDLPDLMALRARNLPGWRFGRLAIDIQTHYRLSLALSSCTLALLGAALGLVFRGANRILAYLLGFLIGPLAYFPLTRIGESVAENTGACPALMLELGNIALLLISVILFRRGGR